MSTEEIIDDILAAEGGYVDDPDDRGGCTKYGITIGTLSEERGEEVDCEAVRHLTEDEARSIYRHKYIHVPGFDQIRDQGPWAVLRELLVDSAVQHGASKAVEWLQEASGAAVDGDFGPNTRGAVNSSDPTRLYNEILAERIRYYGEIISNDHSQARFALGWMRRVTQFVGGME